MRSLIFYSLIIIMFLSSCISTIQQDVVVKVYGESNINKGISFIILDDYKHFDKFYNRVQQIACSDSVPAIQIRSDKNIKHIQFWSPCWNRASCILIKRRNEFEIVDEKIIVDTIYQLEHLDSLLVRHYFNYGKEPQFSIHPSKVLISLSYDTLEMKGLPDLLNSLTESYDKSGIGENLNIWIKKRVIPPPTRSNYD